MPDDRQKFLESFYSLLDQIEEVSTGKGEKIDTEELAVSVGNGFKILIKEDDTEPIKKRKLYLVTD